MTDFGADGIRVIACDIFGTTVDWYSGVRDQVAFAGLGLTLDAGEFASAWRDRYLPSMRRVQNGERDWADCAEGLARLRKRHVVAALSNGGFALLTHLVKDAALPFDCILSAELARTYKPAAAVYRTAAGLLDVEPHEVLMVAAHGWDLDGARAAGFRTAFLERPAGKGPHHAADRAADVRADLRAGSFPELAGLLGC